MSDNTSNQQLVKWIIDGWGMQGVVEKVAHDHPVIWPLDIKKKAVRDGANWEVIFAHLEADWRGMCLIGKCKDLFEAYHLFLMSWGKLRREWWSIKPDWQELINNHGWYTPHQNHAVAHALEISSNRIFDVYQHQAGQTVDTAVRYLSS